MLTRQQWRLAWLLYAVAAFSTLAGCASTTRSTAFPSPEIISVAQWGGTSANQALARRHTISRITLHHQGEAFPRGKDPQQYLRNLQAWSRNTKGWIDVPYHYAIDLDGIIYAGRNIEFAGDTNTEYDPAGHALIEVVGNFEDVEPNAAQLDAVVNVMTMLATRFRIPVENIRGHRDYVSTTVCPGKKLYAYLQNGYFRAEVAKKLRARA